MQESDASESGIDTKKTVDVNMMAEKLGIPLIIIQYALEFPIVINTIKEAKAVYSVTPSGSEAEREALKKWIELVKTPEDAKDACAVAPYKSEEQIEAIRKLALFFTH